VLAVGTRLQDFTTASRTVFANPAVRLLQLNVAKFDAIKHHAQSLVADAKVGLQQLSQGLTGWQSPSAWLQQGQGGIAEWNAYYEQVTAAEITTPTRTGLLSDAQVLGAVKRTGQASDIVVCAAGGLPGELHKLWRTDQPNGYHLEYGFSCMGYEIAGGLGVKMAHPGREVIVLVGDGSYLMLNSEIATSVMLGLKLIIVVLDNRGFGCIQRLQTASGGAAFNNMLQDCAVPDAAGAQIDFAQHARSLGADAVLAGDLAAFRAAMAAARTATKTQVIVIDTTHTRTTDDGGCWWDVAIPEVSQRAQVVAARQVYDTARKDKS